MAMPRLAVPSCCFADVAPFPSAPACLPAGLRVAVLERGPLLGRAQEWNISRKELQELVGAGAGRCAAASAVR